MTEPRLDFVQCLDPQGLHRMAYWEWGDPANPKVLVCVHGLSRQGRDFDSLAKALRDEYRVVCPDVVGRGRSDWLGDPMGYQIPTYVADMVTLLARLNARTLDWVGTSMGGLIGLGLASLPGSPVRRLVLNDVGPTIEPQALARIGTYIGQVRRFETLDEAADYMWSISQGFGPHTREQWLALTRPMLKPLADEQGSGFVPHYDPRIAVPFQAMDPGAGKALEALLWERYEAVKARTLVIRGAESDLLSRATVQEMARRGPKAQVHEFPGVGHAPTLVAPEQIAVVREFLTAP
ncbi:alpha/beta hydrolase [Caldimonas thermodepolymerans]|mgnify:CR=1 FL=1|jgi:Predicted hydrolases or acyltransferases (alpha/beta hydrolase superfamily)|uniref:Alpha/beta hydrolase n=1 Tax=Caldimonas thermodepolymerans TaxID=215580 RepID=A0A2S5T6E4_9BURK|nr:alpha/beta hydrolase [Caldimonas thermodepolymerans]PPE70574.1 alpha/beta hydrolase [Caldimonas thermodepolymerans]QPC30042.1 alpha/beta hydrolase [Caldimonas thermodepolymerans]RDH97667.1 pimeloyl-ACP methyl ester carboxylesterase [Caldimonas thermodepolymerans]TCP10080.1 pimeloyl-ACP methyl ester carboxylesterase [Caldimonas thermodepolymerans]UZG42788.1 alpha/beta hydrolase [Caldimonas thermodepolymerans]